MRNPSSASAASMDIPYYDGTILRFDRTRGWYPVHLGSIAQAAAATNDVSAAHDAALLRIPRSCITHSRDLVALDWDNVRREAMAVTQAFLGRDREQQAEHAARAKAFQRWMSVRDKNQINIEKRACDSIEGPDGPPR
jgi:hypothetical protein